MKRAYEFASTSNAPCYSNQIIDLNGVSPYKRKDENTRYMAQRVADHYNGRSNHIFEERESIPIIHLKKLNNWIKNCHTVTGGDLIKWAKAEIGYYVGIDIAKGSIEDCRTRYSGNANHHQSRSRFTFPARLLCGDCFEVHLDRVLTDDGPFDICKARARRALANVSALLRPGGTFIGTMPDANGLTFGNSVYWIRFDEEYDHKRFRSSTPFCIKYEFHLEDAVDCPAWIVPFPCFQFAELMRRFGILGDGNQDTSTLSSDEWEVAYLYTSFVLKKRGESDPKQQRTNKGPTDIMYTW
ncbi:hypothetical protein MKX03_002101 [Papaver bracteatum]|nr:hypothetical protein MKX03_002101 [Papaver bracteatum]